jgi:hypothetical protein|tara:strand:+ start:22 stop:249 length:228 start_codon:yes stop_codon:yes gene_type:complete
MEENRVQIFINEKEIQYSHQNIVATINSFLPYLTNDDLVHLTEDVSSMMGRRKIAEDKAREEGKNIPIQSNRHDT